MRNKFLTTELKRENRHPPSGLYKVNEGMNFLDPKKANNQSE